MIKIFYYLRQLIGMFFCCVWLAGCASFSGKEVTWYDLGPLSSVASQPSLLPAICISDVNTPAWLDSQRMYFRLAYVNGQQPRPYSLSRWIMSPGQLLSYRIKSHIAQAGGIVLSIADSATDVPLLRLEAQDFMQVFDAPERSKGIISMRASVFNGPHLIAQKSFYSQALASTADAAGGAKALAVASDALSGEIMRWLTELLMKK